MQSSPASCTHSRRGWCGAAALDTLRPHANRVALYGVIRSAKTPVERQVRAARHMLIKTAIDKLMKRAAGYRDSYLVLLSNKR